MNMHLTSASAVMTRIAHAILPEPAKEELGDITLLPHQREAVTRLRTIMATYRGALLADGVGLGKTYIALAVAAEYDHAHIIAPAALLPMWRTAITHAHLPHTSLQSVQSYSGSAPPLQHSARPLIIIDEAHYLRTRRTARHREVARRIGNADVLLLTATPLHNDPGELRSILALFMGSRADVLTTDMLARLVVRRTDAHGASGGAGKRGKPGLHEHAPQEMPYDRETLTQLLALPVPLPAHDGTAAGALIRLGLLRAWCSSDAALAHALRQRLLRGEALRQALSAGRHPTNAELRTWLVGEHEVQLGFPELLADHVAESGPLVEVLEHHLAALEALLSHHQRNANGDAIRARALRTIVERHPGTPVVAFSQFTTTVLALQRALADIAGVGLLTGKRARIASGRVSRAEVLARFAPVAQERPPPPPHQAIRLLLATDLLAEGVNLQDAGVVVHLDLPWTHALQTQRVGRCARLGSPHAIVHVYRFAPPVEGDHALRLQRRIVQKARLARRYVGATDTSTRPSPRDSGADAASRLYALLAESRGHASLAEDGACFLTACATARASGWLALVRYRQHHHLLGARRTASHRWRVGASAPHLLRCLRRVRIDASSVPAVASEQIARVQRAVVSWGERRAALAEIGPPARSLAREQQRARRIVDRTVARLSPVQRLGLQREIAHAYAQLERQGGSGALDLLQEWLDRAPHRSPMLWLRECPAPSVPVVAGTLSAATGEVTASPTLVAVLVLVGSAEPISLRHVTSRAPL